MISKIKGRSTFVVPPKNGEGKISIVVFIAEEICSWLSPWLPEQLEMLSVHGRVTVNEAYFFWKLESGSEVPSKFMFTIIDCTRLYNFAAVTILLALCVYQVIVSDKLPSSSTSIPIVGESISFQTSCKTEFHCCHWYNIWFVVLQ